MNSRYYTKTEDGVLHVVISVRDAPVASLGLKAWDTEFFRRKIGYLVIDPAAAAAFTEEEKRSLASDLVNHAANGKYALVELHLDVRGIAMIPVLEQVGFRLVDTRITYITAMDGESWKAREPPFGAVRMATTADLEDVLRLTHLGFTQNPTFHSRFKNRSYFSPEETERYFAARIKNHIEDSNSVFAVWEVERKAIGYFIYERAGDQLGYPLFKGVLTCVDPEYRGNQGQLFLQSFLYAKFGEQRFYVDNTTQLTNYVVINNHMKSGKMLDRIALTFFWAGR